MVVLLLTAVLSACVTTATWEDQYSDSRETDVSTIKANGSEKYIVYAALDGGGNLIAASDDETEAAAYAVVGYTGNVAELIVPARYAGKNVTKVLVASPYSAYKCYRDVAANGDPVAYSGDDARLANNPVVTSIVFGSGVTFVGAGVCAEMINLTSVHFDHVSAGVTYTNAFLGISPTITFKTA